MHITVKMRRVLARHPWIFWAFCLAFALAAAAIVSRYVTALDEAARDLGTTRTVFVATADQSPGERLHSRPVDMPLGLLPSDAVESADADSILRQRVTAGEVVVSADLATPSGPAALAEPGTLVIGVTDMLARNVRIGLEVQIAAEGIVLADRAEVVYLADDVIFVAVEAGSAPMVALAAHDGTASLLFVP
jgi:hypothetical protein